MAIIRFLLAISVALVHIQVSIPNAKYTILPGLVAVQSFFIISGFFMSLILNEKYSKTKHPYLLYITNRFLRIYPIYWFVLLLVLSQNILNNEIFNVFKSYMIEQNSIASFLNVSLLIIKNITLVLSPDHFIWIKNQYSGLLIFPAWTLVMEVTFYLIAPFIVRKNLKTILVLLIISLVLRIFIWHSNIYPQFNADYFFLPNLVYFILGILAYKLKQLLSYDALSLFLKGSLLILFFIFTLLFLFLPDSHHIKEWLYYLSLTGILPLLFAFDSQVNLRLFGDLSYPIYISHVFILSLIALLKTQSVYLDLLYIIAFSLLLHYFIARPIDKLRSTRVKKNISEDIE